MAGTPRALPVNVRLAKLGEISPIIFGFGRKCEKGICSGDVHASPKSFHVSASQDYPAKLEHESIRAKKDVRQGGKAPECLSVDNPTSPLFNKV